MTYLPFVKSNSAHPHTPTQTYTHMHTHIPDVCRVKFGTLAHTNARTHTYAHTHTWRLVKSKLAHTHVHVRTYKLSFTHTYIHRAFSESNLMWSRS